MSPGGALVRASWVGTVVLLVATAVAVVSAAGPSWAVHTAACLMLFAGGSAAFLWGFATAVGRSRTVAIGIGGLFFLAGSAPASVRRSMLASLAVQTVVSIGGAAARPFTSLAFGVLAPMWGLGLCGLWAARHGRFDPRHPPGR